MQLRTGLVGLLAMVFSVSAALGVYLFTRRPPVKPEIEMVSIVVAVGSAPRGVTLTEEMVQTRQWPKEYVPEGALTLPEEAVGRTIWLPLIENDPIVELKLAAKGAGRGMAALIPPGMRAVTIQTPNVATGVAGFILPGNKVDVLWTVSQSAQHDDTGGGSTATLLQNVEILAVDQQIEMPNDNKVDPRDMRSVTLLVSPPDASKLDLAHNRGTLRLSLRNPEDTVIDAIETATLLGMRQASAIPFMLEPAIQASHDENDIAELTGLRYEESIPAILPPDPPPAEISLPIRTLRGTSGGAVHLRHQLRRVRYAEDRFGDTADRS